MKITKENIKQYMLDRNYIGRKYRFKVIEELLGVNAETAKKIESITRYVRYAFPADETSIPNQKRVLTDMDYISINSVLSGKLFK